MKRIINIIIIISFLLSIGYSNKVIADEPIPSQVSFPEKISKPQFNDIIKMTKVWGFVKYHHPAFANTEWNADAEYFKLLNRIFNPQDSTTNQILLSWINSLGDFEITHYPIRKQHVAINDVYWINDSIELGKDLSQKLINLRSAKRDKNQYLQQTQVNIKFIEPDYSDLPQNDIAYRLLGVAKFWNAIDYYYPNRNITDTKWDEVLPTYINQALDTTIDCLHLYPSLAAKLDDSHANAWNNIGTILGPQIIPIVAQFAENKMFVSDTCTLVPNELQIGDEILSIDGIKPIEKLTNISKYNSHSNQAALLQDASYQSLLTPKNEVKIVYRRHGIDKEFTMQTITNYKFNKYIYSDKSPIIDKSFGKINKDVAYINIGKLKNDEGEKMFKFIKKYKYLIIDLRHYPAEYNVIHSLLPQYFFNEKRQACTLSLPIAKRPGYCRKIKMFTNETTNPENLYQGKIALLVDANTMSMGEMFTMYLQTNPNTITIGSCTAGADGDVTNILLPYSSKGIFFSGANISYPDGTNAQRKGVKIDYKVEPTAESMIKNEDYLLIKAIEILKKHFQ